MQFDRLKRRLYCGVHGTLAANLNRFLTSRLLRWDRARTVTVYGAVVGEFEPGAAIKERAEQIGTIQSCRFHDG
jgi:hypothetical protein